MMHIISRFQSGTKSLGRIVQSHVDNSYEVEKSGKESYDLGNLVLCI
jgi:hypothetical protein